MSSKRYRYISKERDEETGLCQHGARYYAPWLARWTSADRSGLADGPNLYRYAGNRPLVLLDRNGRADEPFSKKFMTGLATFVVTGATGIPPDQAAKAARYAIDTYREQSKIPQAERTGGKRIEGHHVVQDEWAKKNVWGYRSGAAVSQFLETGTGQEHTSITNNQKANRPANGRWDKKGTSAAFTEAAEQYKNADLITDQKKGLEAFLKATGHFFELGDEVQEDPKTGKRTVVKNARIQAQLKAAERRAKVLAALVRGGGNALKVLGPVGMIVGLESSAAAAERGEYGVAAFELGTTVAGAAGDVVDAGRAGLDVGEAIGEYHGIYDKAGEHGEAVRAYTESLGAGETISTVAGGVATFYSAGYQAEAALLPQNLYGMAYDLVFE